ncbi:MAG: GntR family transcriptional regulator [Desulforhabdus sp.]|jgi:DNA-binding GntR family transcriptional regulator|nr:GntR family transcriptional regulator [Desulforhabdus sp.]
MSSKIKPLYCKIFHELRDRIVFGAYPPGLNLPEKELCEEFKVSRTPLREAFLKLQDMKLVTVIPRFGTTVTPVDINEIRCSFEVKIELEGLAGKLAAERIKPDKLEELDAVINEAALLLRTGGSQRHHRLIEIEGRFHEIIRQAARNPVLQEMLDNLHYRCARLWSSALSEVVPDEEIIDQMRKVSVALKECNSDAARVHMEEHVQYFIEKIKKVLL